MEDRIRIFPDLVEDLFCNGGELEIIFAASISRFRGSRCVQTKKCESFLGDPVQAGILRGGIITQDFRYDCMVQAFCRGDDPGIPLCKVSPTIKKIFYFFSKLAGPDAIDELTDFFAPFVSAALCISQQCRAVGLYLEEVVPREAVDLLL